MMTNARLLVRSSLVVFLAALVLGVTARGVVARETNEQLASQVRETEAAFAKTMADRDHTAFMSFVADEAVFFGGKSVLRGKAAVAAGWKPLFEAPGAPFSWAPDRVEVLDSGKLALSTGPIRDEKGRDIGSFMSTWRRDGRGKWKIVFDKGCPPCPPLDQDADIQEIHRQLSVKYFNECWDLIDKKTKNIDDVENMLLLADASLWHWKQRTDCRPIDLSVGYWQVSRVHAMARQPEMARLFGQKCLAVGQNSKLPPFYIGYACEALARAEMVAGNDEAAWARLTEARDNLSAIADKEQYDVLERDIVTLEKTLAGD